MSKPEKPLARPASAGELKAFLRQVAAAPARASGGRLLFALDATASREPTWDQAGAIQAEMFEATANLGGLAVQLCFYRGFGEFEASPWCVRSADLRRRMTQVRCAAGHTQIARVLQHALDECARQRLQALVFIGDCVEEPPDSLADLAGRLGLFGVPAFVFQEGADATAARTLRTLATLTRGAYFPFDTASPGVLRDLLGAVAVFAAGGREALERLGRRRGGVIRQLTAQLTPR